MGAHRAGVKRNGPLTSGGAADLPDHFAGRVDRLDYKTLRHPGHELAAAQMSAFGGMISVQFADGATARRFAESTRLFQLAESLGGVESLIEVPGPMTHASVAGSPCEVPAQLVRLSVGLEDVEDLREDLEQALSPRAR